MRLALIVALALVALSGCNVYHLREAGGNDAGPGTEAQPWLTLKQSLPKLRAGDTLIVHDGVYRNEQIPPLAVAKGTSSAPITVMAGSGEHPVILGYMHLLQPDWWTIQGLNFSYGESASGTNELVRISGGTNWKFTNNEIAFPHSTAGLHIDDGSADNRPVGTFTVSGNCIHDTIPTNAENQDHNIYMDDLSGSPAANGLIERNLLFNAPNGRGIKFGPGSVGGPHHVTARYNTIYNSAQNIGVSKNAHDITLERNLLYGVNKAYAGNIYSFELSGLRNVARNNAGGSAPALLRADPTTTVPVTDGGGNVTLTTGFDSIRCTGLRPTNSQAQAYGRYAP